MFIPRHVFPRYNVARQDFKGHQLKALRRLDTLKPQIQLICEIRDIRAPLSTRNVLIDKITDKRLHEKLVIYTRKDLMARNPEYLDKLRRWHDELGENYMMINAKRGSDVANVLRTLQWYKRQHEQRLEGVPLPMGYKVLVSGMPNVGKSTLINSLRTAGPGGPGAPGAPGARRPKVARTGAEAGVTRSTSELIRVGGSDDQIYLIDTPGIGLPGRLNAGDRMIVLSLCGCIKQGVVDPLVEADYLLYLMNLQRDGQTSLSQWYPGADSQPSNEVQEVLERLRRSKSSTHEDLARSWLQHSAALGGIVLDKELLLHTDEFSLKAYVRNELALAADFETGTQNPQNTRRAQNNAVFGRRRT